MPRATPPSTPTPEKSAALKLVFADGGGMLIGMLVGIDSVWNPLGGATTDASSCLGGGGSSFFSCVCSVTSIWWRTSRTTSLACIVA